MMDLMCAYYNNHDTEFVHRIWLCYERVFFEIFSKDFITVYTVSLPLSLVGYYYSIELPIIHPQYVYTQTVQTRTQQYPPPPPHTHTHTHTRLPRRSFVSVSSWMVWVHQCLTLCPYSWTSLMWTCSSCSHLDLLTWVSNYTEKLQPILPGHHGNSHVLKNSWITLEGWRLTYNHCLLLTPR